MQMTWPGSEHELGWVEANKNAAQTQLNCDELRYYDKKSKIKSFKDIFPETMHGSNSN
jgi:hypothetical protein